jgi:hypothetical protein
MCTVMCKAVPKRTPKEVWPVQVLENLGNVVVGEHKISVQRPNPKKNMVYGTLCQSWHLMLTPESRFQHIYHGQPYARVDFIPQSRTSDLASSYLRTVPVLVVILKKHVPEH